MRALAGAATALALASVVAGLPLPLGTGAPTVPTPAPAAGLSVAPPAPSVPAPPAGRARAGGTRLVLLGTGTPNADPERWGPALAVIVDGVSYLVDAGPGVVRRAAGAAGRLGIGGLDAPELRRVFLTHLHSDHTLGLPDLMLSPWVLDRPEPLRVWGPPGTRAMARSIQEAWSRDVEVRIYGLEPKDHPEAYRAVVTEIPEGGEVYRDGRVRVTAIPVRHGSFRYAYGYRFETSDRVVVVSGDARPSPSLVEACDGCDVLVHEVYSVEAFRERPPEWRRYHREFHTSTAELAELAARARPELLVLHHQLFWGTDGEDLVREIREAGYRGRVASGRDLEVY